MKIKIRPVHTKFISYGGETRDEKIIDTIRLTTHIELNHDEYINLLKHIKDGEIEVGLK